ncbi:MAG: DMT family transporter [Polyangiaceae bacterium]
MPSPSSPVSANMLRVHGALLVVQILFALWPVAGAALLEVMTPRALIFVRLTAGAPILAIATLAIRRSAAAGRATWAERVRVGIALAGLAALGISINQLLFAEGLKRAGPINASIMVMLIPPLTVAIAAALGRERPSAGRLGGVAISLVGAALLVGAERFDLGAEHTLGNLLLLGNTTAYAFYLVLARPILGRLGALVTMAFVLGFGALEALPITLRAALETDWSALRPLHWALLGFVVAGPTLLTYLLNGYALARAESTLVAVYVYVQPPIAAAATFFAFGTKPTTRTVIAALVIFAGVALSTGLAVQVARWIRRPAREGRASREAREKDV